MGRSRWEVKKFKENVSDFAVFCFMCVGFFFSFSEGLSIVLCKLSDYYKDMNLVYMHHILTS